MKQWFAQRNGVNDFLRFWSDLEDHAHRGEWDIVRDILPLCLEASMASFFIGFDHPIALQCYNKTVTSIYWTAQEGLAKGDAISDDGDDDI
jgi:hypothetical protein